MDILLTVVALVINSCGAVACWIALRSAENATAARDELASGIRKLNATREELLVLEKRLDKLAGRVYAQSRRPAAVEEEPFGNGVGEPIDPELAAELALQLAPAPAPGKRQ